MNSDVKENELVISDYYDLLNLHKALVEVKFLDNPNNRCIAGSPIIARISNRIVELLTVLDKRNGREKLWIDWRKITNHDYYKDRIIKLIAEIETGWKAYDDERKRNVVLNYSAPFICSEADINQILRSVEEKING